MRDITSCCPWWRELLDGHSIQKRAARWILVNPSVVKHNPHRRIRSPESPGIRIRSVTTVYGLHGDVAGERRHRHPQHLVLRASPGGTEREGVESAGLEICDPLRDCRLVAQPKGVLAVGDDDEHSAGQRPAGYVLHEALDRPVREGVPAGDDCVLELGRVGADLKVAIWKEF